MLSQILQSSVIGILFIEIRSIKSGKYDIKKCKAIWNLGKHKLLIHAVCSWKNGDDPCKHNNSIVISSKVERKRHFQTIFMPETPKQPRHTVLCKVVTYSRSYVNWKQSNSTKSNLLSVDVAMTMKLNRQDLEFSCNLNGTFASIIGLFVVWILILQMMP
jgi:hypothetical protein